MRILIFAGDVVGYTMLISLAVKAGLKWTSSGELSYFVGCFFIFKGGVVDGSR